MLKTYLETSKQSIEHWLSAVLNSPIPEYLSPLFLLLI